MHVAHVWVGENKEVMRLSSSGTSWFPYFHRSTGVAQVYMSCTLAGLCY